MREKLIQILSEDKAYPDCKNCKTPVGHCNRCVLELHVDNLIANGVEIPVRCKDCKSYDPGYIRPYCGWCSTWETAVRESGYCHHGERRTE